MSDYKRSATDESRGVAKRQRLVEETLRLVDFPTEVRVRILQYSTIDDLSNVCLTSRQCLEDCRDRSLPQMRTAVFFCNLNPRITSDFKDVLTKIRHAERRNVFYRFRRLKLKNHAGLKKITNSVAQPIIGYGTLRLRATSLDLSLPPGVVNHPKKHREVAACIPKYLSKIMPHLTEVDLSYVIVAQSALSDFARDCPNLERVRWERSRSNVFASGQDLKKCKTLKELYMDNSCFYVSGSLVQPQDEPTHEQRLFDMPEDDFCVLYFCRQKLERVSLRRATYRNFGDKKGEENPFTQLGLMKFVRSAPNLRWFRSDLTAENVAILLQERPGITFA